MRIWAHRGCSQRYPENTLTAFAKAMNIPGLCGIELDIQLTKDGELVVIHDERVDRTTDGVGFVRDFTLEQLRTCHIHTGRERAEYIPTMREVLELLMPKLKKWRKEQENDTRVNIDFGMGGGYDTSDLGICLNIELKNSIYPYKGMESKIVDMVHEFGVENAIVYSSFYADSLYRLHEIDPEAEIGVLDNKVSDCLYKAIGLESLINNEESSFRFALHPYGNEMDIDSSRFENRPVRAWFTGHLYPEKPTGGILNIAKYETLGITDVFLNEPEKYLG